MNVFIIAFVLVTIVLLMKEYKNDIVKFNYLNIVAEIISFIAAIMGIYYAQTDPMYAKIMATLFSVCWIGFIISSIIKSVKKIKGNK